MKLIKIKVMKASDILIEKIKEFEGFSSKAYKCPAGIYTCGYGTTKDITASTRCTPERAEQWLKRDLEPIEEYLNTISELNTQGRYDSCVDFCYNLGIGAFKGSTLLAKIRAKAPAEEIQAQFRRWVYAGKKKLVGLVKRREWEAKRWTE